MAGSMLVTKTWVTIFGCWRQTDDFCHPLFNMQQILSPTSNRQKYACSLKFGDSDFGDMMISVTL